MCCGISPPNSHIPPVYPPLSLQLLFIFTPCVLFNGLYVVQSYPVMKMADENVVFFAFQRRKVACFVIPTWIRSRLSWEQRCQHQEDRQGGPGEQSLCLLSPSGKNFLSSHLHLLWPGSMDRSDSLSQWCLYLSWSIHCLTLFVHLINKLWVMISVTVFY